MLLFYELFYFLFKFKCCAYAPFLQDCYIAFQCLPVFLTCSSFLSEICTLCLWLCQLMWACLIGCLAFQSYSRDLFVFLYLLLIIASAMTSLKKHHDKSAFSGKSLLYLNRHQTEEWKGWMQVSLSSVSIDGGFPVHQVYIQRIITYVCMCIVHNVNKTFWASYFHKNIDLCIFLSNNLKGTAADL